MAARSRAASTEASIWARSVSIRRETEALGRRSGLGRAARGRLDGADWPEGWRRSPIARRPGHPWQGHTSRTAPKRPEMSPPPDQLCHRGWTTSSRRSQSPGPRDLGRGRRTVPRSIPVIDAYPPSPLLEPMSVYWSQTTTRYTPEASQPTRSAGSPSPPTVPCDSRTDRTGHAECSHHASGNVLDRRTPSMLTGWPSRPRCPI